MTAMSACVLDRLALAGGSAVLCLGLVAGVPASAASRVQAQDGHVRYVVNKHSGKCLTVRGVAKADNATVDQYRCVGARNQQWILEQGGGDPVLGSLVLRNVNSGNGARWRGQGSQARPVHVCRRGQPELPAGPVGDNTMLCAHPLSMKLAVEVQGASTAEDAAVITWPDNRNTNERWDITRKA